ncbi:MAG: J domain-containing protein [Cryobacterium sp.]
MSASDRGLYGVLGVSASADAAELKRAYRHRLRVAHPDTGGSDADFSRVQDAWAVLGRPDRRADYDRARAEALLRAERGARATGTGPVYRAQPPSAPSRARSGFRPAFAAGLLSIFMVGPAAGENATPFVAGPGGPGPRPGPADPARDRAADMHGLAGGSARQRYLSRLRSWLGVAPPPRPVRLPHSLTDPYLRIAGRWLWHLLMMTTGFCATGAVVALFIAWQLGVGITGGSAALAAVILTGGGIAAICGAMISLAVMLLRTIRDPSRRDARQLHAERRRVSSERWEEYRRECEAFSRRQRARPANAQHLMQAPFSAETRRYASAEIRAELDRAIAAETTARALTRLGGDFSIWHDLVVGPTGVSVDHVVVGRQGLVLLVSLAATEPVTVEQNVVMYAGRPAPQVLAALRPQIAALSRAVGSAGIAAAVLVYPDGVLSAARLRSAGAQRIGGLSVPTFILGASVVVPVLAAGLPGVTDTAGWQLVRLRESVAARTRFAS